MQFILLKITQGKSCDLMLAFRTLIALTILASSSAIPAKLTKVDLDNFPSARCLDGSPGAYYTQPSLSSDPKKYVFSLQGGGECTGLYDCTSRSQSDLGSSDHLALSLDISSQRFLSQNEEENPFWFDATHVRVAYCSGDIFSGDGALNEEVGGLYFSGARIIDAVVKEVSKGEIGR